MFITYDSSKNVVKAVLDGEIDHHLAKNIRERIDAEILEKQPGLLILDFCNVTFMDSSGIGLVMGRFRQMQLIEGRLLVTNVTGKIKKVMRLAGLEKLGVIEEEFKNEAN